jgi:N utilization substance protein B
MVGNRRKARTIALQALYELDCSAHQPNEALERLLREKKLPIEAGNFVRSLINGVLENKQKIDAIIRRLAPAFPVGQIAPIDRNILRLAIFEVLFDNRVPVKAAINEAVELAKSFGSDTSPKFVNGVLGSVTAVYLQEKLKEETGKTESA